MITGNSLSACIAEAKKQGYTTCSRAVRINGVWSVWGLK